MPEDQLRMRELKTRAQLLKPAIRLGKAGLTPEFVVALEETLDRSQLVKVRFEGFKEERKSMAKELAQRTGSLLIQQVGFTAVYYRLKSPSAERVTQLPAE